MRRAAVISLIQQVQAAQGTACPCHSQSVPIRVPSSSPFSSSISSSISSTFPSHAADSVFAEKSTDYAFEMASSTVRFGRGVTREVGMDVENMGAKNVLVVTDKNIASLPSFTVLLDSLNQQNINFDVFDGCAVEPTDTSFMEAIQHAKNKNPDAFVVMGGGSAMDTAKAANLYMSYPDAELLDFVNAPVGKGKPVPGPVKPLIAIPTTAGTGSETTGVAIFDYMPLKAKTGIGSRWIRPTLGIIDPNNSDTMPTYVATASGFDVLCHALESYTAIPFDKRSPRPPNPKLRPTYQGSNPMSDVWSMTALDMLGKYFVRAVRDPEDFEAKEAMLLASTMAGVGFGNAGVHLCHGMSYAISGLNKKEHVQYSHPDYSISPMLIPHGVSVCVTAPAIFQATAHTDPQRHIDAARALGLEYNGVVDAETAGQHLKETLLKYMQTLEIPLGLEALGYRSDDIDELVEGTLPQKRVTDLAPSPVDREFLQSLFESSMSY